MGERNTTPDPGPTPDQSDDLDLPIDTDAAELRHWNEDLDVLAREMPVAHANLFHTLGRQQFDDAIADIRRRLPRLARHQVIVELDPDLRPRLAMATPACRPGEIPLASTRFRSVCIALRTATTFVRPPASKQPCSAAALLTSAVSPSIRQRSS